MSQGVYLVRGGARSGVKRGDCMKRPHPLYLVRGGSRSGVEFGDHTLCPKDLVRGGWSGIWWPHPLPQRVYLVRGGSRSGVKGGTEEATPFAPRSVSGQGRIQKWSERGD